MDSIRQQPEAQLRLGGPSDAEHPGVVRAPGEFALGKTCRGQDIANFKQTADMARRCQSAEQCFIQMLPWLHKLALQMNDLTEEERNLLTNGEQNLRINVNLEDQTADWWVAGTEKKWHKMNLKPQQDDMLYDRADDDHNPVVLKNQIYETMCEAAGIIRDNPNLDKYERGYQGSVSHPNGLTHLDPKSNGLLPHNFDAFYTLEHLRKLKPELTPDEALNIGQDVFALQLYNDKMILALEEEIDELQREREEIEDADDRDQERLTVINNDITLLQGKKAELEGARERFFAINILSTIEALYPHIVEENFPDDQRAEFVRGKVEEYLKNVYHVSTEKKWMFFTKDCPLNQMQKAFAARVGAIAFRTNRLGYTKYCYSHRIDPKENTGIEGSFLNFMTAPACIVPENEKYASAQKFSDDLLNQVFSGLSPNILKRLKECSRLAQEDINDLWYHMETDSANETTENAIILCRQLGQEAIDAVRQSGEMESVDGSEENSNAVIENNSEASEGPSTVNPYDSDVDGDASSSSLTQDELSEDDG